MEQIFRNYYYDNNKRWRNNSTINSTKNDELNAIAIIMTYTLERIDHYDGYGFMMPHAFAY
jgi:hypothetical protein